MIKPEEIITLDFETYYDSDYTLKKLATSEYIRDERFKAQCVGLKIGTDNVIWIPDRHVEEAIRSIDWPAYALCAHHAQFDGFILTERYGVTPAYYLCTMSMGKGLHSLGVGASLDALAQYYGVGHKLPDVLSKTRGIRDLPPELLHELGTYCMVDDQLCFDLFMKMIDRYSQSELDLIDETCRMFCEPVLHVNPATAYRALVIEKDNKRRKIEQSETDPANLSSNLKFATLLESLDVEIPMKTSPTTGKPTFAFAKSDFGFQELMVHDDEAVRAVVAARIAVKSTLGETRAQRLLDETCEGHRPIPVYLKYYGAHTGRWSGGNKMNLQNLPRIYPDDPDSGLLRKSIIAPPGYVIVVSDLAQIEARMLAWLAKDKELLQQFRDKIDAYKIMAAETFQKPVEEITKNERFVGKTAILGLGYQMGWRRFLLTITLGLMGPKMDMEPDTAKQVVTTYRQKRTAIVEFWGVCTDMLYHMYYDMDMEYGPLRVVGIENRIYMPNGMYLEYPGLSQSNDGFIYFNYADAKRVESGRQPHGKGKKLYGGILAENITQALARIVIGEHLLEVRARYKVVSTTHDELIGIAPEEEADAALEFMIETMRKAPEWCFDLPLDAEGGWAKEYCK